AIRTSQGRFQALLGQGSYYAGEFTFWYLALAAVSYLLLELNESKLRRLGFDKFEVDTRTWWARPVCWATAFAYGFCVLASNI
ncbi:hypothetical protein, partial [Azotobacter beijerinckii]|uniref:hypothetical protein n=1 Tax=Azotobacter beijerinckii TaxID=170623 RepID=UPI001B8C12A8